MTESRRTIYWADTLQQADRMVQGMIHVTVLDCAADLSWTHVYIKDKSDFDRDYLNCIASLSVSSSSQFWWANSLSEKNEMLSPVFKRLYVLKAVCLWLDQHTDKDVVCVGMSHGMKISLHSYASSRGWIVRVPRVWNELVGRVKNYARWLIKLVMMSARNLYRAVKSRLVLKKRLEEISRRKVDSVIKAWVDHRNFASSLYTDPYFGNLPEFLGEKGRSVIAADTVRDFNLYLEDMRKESEIAILPLEITLKLSSLMQAIGVVLKGKARVAGVVLRDVNVDAVLNEDLRENYFSQKYFESVLYFFKTRDFLNVVRSHSFIYTFENYAWEKMCLLACQDTEDSVKTIGFQHAFIAQNSFKYLLGQDEIDSVPKPDKIITIGAATQRILSTYGLWPENTMITGGALRQASMPDALDVDRTRADVLIALTMTEEDTVNIIEFIYKADLHKHGYNVYFRFHPQTDIGRVVDALSFTWPDAFKRSTVSLQEDFQRVGLVLYTWTTVSLEAVRAGIPSIYINVHHPYDLNPLFDCPYLNTAVVVPEELSKAMSVMRSLEEDEYQRQWSEAKQYLSEYFYPANEKAMELFCV